MTDTIIYAVSAKLPIYDASGARYVYRLHLDGQTVAVIHPANARVLQEGIRVLGEIRLVYLGQFDLDIPWRFHVDVCEARWN